MNRGVAGSSPAGSALYAIARKDLATGLRTAQVGHALIGWVIDHGQPPENLVVLQVPDERALLELHEKLQNAKVRLVAFNEPDLGGELTAIAVGSEAKKLLSSLPLLR